jgi:hypothetical protein
MAALVHHVAQPGGTLARNASILLGRHPAESTLSQRRSGMDIAEWTAALRHVASRQQGGACDAFERRWGLRLVGVDGTSFHMANSPSAKALAHKVPSRRGEEAFPRIGCAVACALSTRRPLAMAVGIAGESEGVLAASATEGLGAGDLLVADRYYGNARWAAVFSRAGGPDFVLRVPSSLKPRVLHRLGDGSAMVAATCSREGTEVVVREVRANVRRPGKPWTLVRIWTSLADPAAYPAEEIARVYAMRWEQESAFRELKRRMRGGAMLASATPATAAQEVVALVIAQSIVAAERAEIAMTLGLDPLAVSFGRLLEAQRLAARIENMGAGIVGCGAIAKLVEAIVAELAWCPVPPRRQRSCPRMIRKPVSKWHRLLENQYWDGECELEIIR